MAIPASKGETADKYCLCSERRRHAAYRTGLRVCSATTKTGQFRRDGVCYAHVSRRWKYEELGCEEFDLGPVRKLRCNAADKLPLCQALLGRIERPGIGIIENSVPPEHPDANWFLRSRNHMIEMTAGSNWNSRSRHSHCGLQPKSEFIPGFSPCVVNRPAA